MNGRWIKVVIFVLLIVMITSVVTALLDPGLGKPEDARRTRHLDGFSICYPIGWGGTAFGGSENGVGNGIRLAQERKVGRETTITVLCSGSEKPTLPNPREGVFQSQPATFSARSSSQNWQWRMVFERNGRWYSILLATPIPLEVEKSPYWPFIESFRVDKKFEPTTQFLPGPTTQSGS